MIYLSVHTWSIHNVNLSELALFGSGIFFGGAVDHTILAAKGSEIPHYGVHSGIMGNWAFAGLDFGLAISLYIFYRRLAKKTAVSPLVSRVY